jgi:hypothetical protein
VELDPSQGSDVIREWSGEVLGRMALGDPTVTELDIYEAVGASLALSAVTLDELLSPRNSYVVDLFCTP